MSVGIIWTSYHYYLGEIASLFANSGVSVTMYMYLESAEEAPLIEGVEFRNIRNFSHSELLSEVLIGNHNTVLICGWHLKPFRHLARNFNGRVVLFMDNPWKTTLKQILGVLIFKLKWLSYYDGVVVPGYPQKRFAQYLGFKTKDIHDGFFSFLPARPLNEVVFVPRREFIFIGRLIELKGIAELSQAYVHYRSKVSDPWPLIICGDGPLRSSIENRPGIQMKGFLSKKELLNELRSPRVFISCGKGEHWGISIYEAAFFCHPLILSLDAGAGSEYLRNGSNGISIKGRDIDDIERAMIEFHNLQNSDLELYARASSQLSKKHDSGFFVSEVIPFIMKAGKLN